MVDRLERAGHVERVRDTGDRRRVIVTETAIARRAAYEAWFPVIDSVDEVCRALPDGDRTIVVDLSSRVTTEIGKVEQGVPDSVDGP